MKNFPKQQKRLFFQELITFALLFTTLGFIVYLIFQSSVYRDINVGLDGQKEQILGNRPPKPLKNESQRPLKPTPEGPFRFNIVVFNSKGKIINADMLGDRNYNLLKDVKLDQTQLDEKRNLTLTSDQETSHFRTLLIKVPDTNPDPIYAGNLVLILENIDAEILSINSFKRTLIFTILIFAILAIVISYVLSEVNIKPIIKSWQKQRDFSTNAAHELKTPLTIIKNQMEFLLTKPQSTIIEQADEISTTLNEVEHLQTMTERLLILARQDSNLIEIQRKPIELYPWFSALLKPYQEFASVQNKTLLINLNVRKTVALDPDLIQQLLTILLDNAFKYTTEGAIISVNSKTLKNNLIIEVTDTGAGISDDDKKHIFERFYRTDHSHNSKTGGVGLGLSIAAWIIKAHRGIITVDDNKPQGTIFTIKLPLTKNK